VRLWLQAGFISREKAAPIVVKLSERMGTACAFLVLGVVSQRNHDQSRSPPVDPVAPVDTAPPSCMLLIARLVN